MNKRHFRRGGGGVFTCRCCDRKTRHVDQPIGSELCPECDELAGLDNMVNDDCGGLEDVIASRDAALKSIEKKGGNVEKVKRSNGYLWPED